MSAQINYGFSTPIGSAGGIVDLAPYAIDSFLNDEDNGKLKFGIGVVRGEKPGVGIKLPATDSTAAKFEGITTNNRTTEYNMDGDLSIRKLDFQYEILKNKEFESGEVHTDFIEKNFEETA